MAEPELCNTKGAPFEYIRQLALAQMSGTALKSLKGRIGRQEM
jgi:hypothetical protein